MTRQAHHRSDYRPGPHHSFLRRKSYHLAKMIAHIRASERMLRETRYLSGGAIYITPVARLEWRRTLEDALVYANDDTGEVWR